MKPRQKKHHNNGSIVKFEIGIRQYLHVVSHTALGASPHTWLQLISKYRKEISWQYVPKILCITIVVLLNTPVIWWERIRFNAAIRNTKVKDPIFIIGHPRSGTTYLHYLMGRDPQFAYCSTYESFMPWIFLSMESFLKVILKNALPETRPMDNVKLGADLPKEEEFAIGNMGYASMVPGYYFPRRMHTVFKKFVLFEHNEGKEEWQQNLKYFMQKLTMKYGGKPLVMKSPENLGRVKEILEIFPNARFIHIYRNPYTVYFSTERLYEKILPIVALQQFTVSDVEDFIIKSYMDTFKKFFEDRELIPKGNLVEFSYEEFIGSEMEILSKAYAQLGISGFDKARPLIEHEVESQMDYQTNIYDQPELRKQQIYNEWKLVFERLGYSR